MFEVCYAKTYSVREKKRQAGGLMFEHNIFILSHFREKRDRQKRGRVYIRCAIGKRVICRYR